MEHSAKHFGNQNNLPPINLSDDQEELCRRLDEWHKKSGLSPRPSDMFRGAVFAIQDECSSNPDRIAQAAHSLREILYPYQSKQVKRISKKGLKALTFKYCVRRYNGDYIYFIKIFPLTIPSLLVS